MQGKDIESLLGNPILWGVVALLALAVALSGKLSGLGATILVWIACGLAGFGIYRLASSFEQPLPWLVTVGSLLLLAAAAVGLNRWLQRRDLPVLDAPTQGSQSHVSSRSATSDVASQSSQPQTTRPSGGVGHVPNQTLSSDAAIAKLTGQGWEVRQNPTGFVIRWADKPLPNMEASATYLGSLPMPFRLLLQQVPNLDGLHLLGKLGNCSALEISASDLTNADELATFAKLRELVISQVPLNAKNIFDISSLTHLRALKKVTLGSVRAESLDPLRGTTGLESVNLNQSLFRDISAISGDKSLRSLDVRGTNIVDMTPLDGFSDLEDLNIDTKQMPSLSGVKGLVSLRKIMIIDQSPVDLSYLDSFKSLTSLAVFGATSIDIHSLDELTQLEQLQLTSFAFGGSPLANVTDPAVIGRLSHLTTLGLSGLALNSISFVVGCPALKDLSLQHMPVSNLDALSGMKSLQRVSLVDVPVVEVTPLLNTPSLRELTVLRTPARADVLAELERRGVKVSNP